MKKRIRKKFASLDASGVKEIARMQEYITNLENFLWRMAMTIEGRDNGEMIVLFTEEGSPTRHATNVIYDFIKEKLKNNKEEKK